MLAAGEKDLASDAAKIAISDQVQIEDIAICEAVQKNLHSRSYHRRRYSVKQERGVHAFPDCGKTGACVQARWKSGPSEPRKPFRISDGFTEC